MEPSIHNPASKLLRVRGVLSLSFPNVLADLANQPPITHGNALARTYPVAIRVIEEPLGQHVPAVQPSRTGQAILTDQRPLICPSLIRELDNLDFDPLDGFAGNAGCRYNRRGSGSG
jgi:hypothetical protein